MTHPGNDNDAESAAACPDLSTSSSIATIGLLESFRNPTETCHLIAVKNPRLDRSWRGAVLARSF
jgi:hypothetical protein